MKYGNFNRILENMENICSPRNKSNKIQAQLYVFRALQHVKDGKDLSIASHTLKRHMKKNGYTTWGLTFAKLETDNFNLPWKYRIKDFFRRMFGVPTFKSAVMWTYASTVATDMEFACRQYTRKHYQKELTLHKSPTRAMLDTKTKLLTKPYSPSLDML